MQYFEEVKRTVCDDACVRIDHSSYAARPAPIGSKVLVRVFTQRIEIRDLSSLELLRTHAKAERPGTVVLPLEERVFNPSRETRYILKQARAIGEQASRLCEMLFAVEGRVGQRKLWGIVNLSKRYPARCIDAACAQAMDQGVYSYKQVKALTERMMEQALEELVSRADEPQTTATPRLVQQHELIRDSDEYGDLFTRAAQVTTTLRVEGRHL